MFYFGTTCILFSFFTSAHEDNFHLYPSSRAICKQLLNHGGKLARIHHVVAEFTIRKSLRVKLTPSNLYLYSKSEV